MSPSATDLLSAQLEANRALLGAIVKHILTDQQKSDLSVSLRNVTSDALQHVVHDDLTDEEATLMACGITELAIARDLMQAV